jgi:predicted transcriptional regulator
MVVIMSTIMRIVLKLVKKNKKEKKQQEEQGQGYQYVSSLAFSPFSSSVMSQS